MTWKGFHRNMSVRVRALHLKPHAAKKAGQHRTRTTEPGQGDSPAIPLSLYVKCIGLKNDASEGIVFSLHWHLLPTRASIFHFPEALYSSNHDWEGIHRDLPPS